jgi:hypothetical protein
VEIGAGVGTMLERLLEQTVLRRAEYVALERDGAHREVAARRHQGWAVDRGYDWTRLSAERWRLEAPGAAVDVDWRVGSLFDDLPSLGRADVVLAHAFLDLVDLDRALPRMLSLLDRRGLFYFTLNFDGMTIFLPEIEAGLDTTIEREYHASMDERRDGAHSSGDSRTGRRLLAELPRHGAAVTAAGSSDWIVLPSAGAYPEGEALVLGTMLDMVEESVGRRRAIDPQRFTQWMEARRRQLENGELIFLAHQIDVVGRKL